MSKPQVPGPYWTNETPAGEHQVCGRHGRVLFTYRADQHRLAVEHVRQLQKGQQPETSEEALRYGQEMARKLLANRVGHGGGPCMARRLTGPELAAVAAIAFQAGLDARS